MTLRGERISDKCQRRSGALTDVKSQLTEYNVDGARGNQELMVGDTIHILEEWALHCQPELLAGFTEYSLASAVQLTE